MVGSLGLSWGVLGMGHGGVGAWRGWKVDAGLIRVKEEGWGWEGSLAVGFVDKVLVYVVTWIGVFHSMCNQLCRAGDVVSCLKWSVWNWHRLR